MSKWNVVQNYWTPKEKWRECDSWREANYVANVLKGYGMRVMVIPPAWTSCHRISEV